MQCPHCRHEFDTKPHTFALGVDPDGTWQVAQTRCPTCDHLIVSVCTDRGCSYPAWPVGSMRPALSPDVPSDLAAEYRIASQVLHYSPEASAAISRRLLSRFLSEYLEAGEGDLAEQIRAAVASPALPTYLKQALLTLSQVARLEVAETKSLCPTALAGAEPGEAEWMLDVLDPLFELYFVQPALMQRKMALLEEQVGLLDPNPADESPEPGDQATASEPGEDAATATSVTSDDPPDADVVAVLDQAIPADAPEATVAAAEADPDTPGAQDHAASADDATVEQQPSPTRETDKPGWRRLAGR